MRAGLLALVIVWGAAAFAQDAGTAEAQGASDELDLAQLLG